MSASPLPPLTPDTSPTPSTTQELLQPTPVVSQLKRSGLSTQIEIHDRHQLEIRFNYAVGSDEGVQRYTVDTWFFVPRNVGLNKSNFSRATFYGDVTALMRLDAAPLRLDHLADATRDDSPMKHLTETLEAFRTSPRPPRSQGAVVHVKLYAFLFTVGLRAEMSRLGKLISLLDARGAAGHAAFEAELDATMKRARLALDSFRKLRAALWPYEKLAHHSLAEATRASDEYMSLSLEERLTKFSQTLDQNLRRFDGTGYVARCRLALSQLAREEAAYRRRYGYLVFDANPNSQAGEYFTYRAGHLKKTIEQALYLDPREVPADMFMRNAVGSVGAALAAVWAFAAQLPRSIAEVSGSMKFLLFAAAVGAYVLKDRIKFYMNEVVGPRVRVWDHTWWLEGAALTNFGLDAMRARLQEKMVFIRESDVPEAALNLRKAGRSVAHIDHQPEEVIHYNKQLDVSATDDRAHIPSGYWVRDILRLNVRHFLVRLDEPLDEVSYFDASKDAFATARLPKVYHVNIVARVRREDASGERHERLEHLRVVLNKDGIVRVEEAGGAGPYPLPKTGRRLSARFPSRLRPSPRKR